MSVVPRVFRLLFLVASAGLPCCGREPLRGPPDLRPGRDQCAECGMLISEDRCSSALLLEQDGHRDYALFDDIGCMLDVERSGLGTRKVVERYVHDHNDKAWVKAEDAVFLLADPEMLNTPMGTGMIGFAKRADAESAQAKHGGRVLDYGALMAARAAREEARRGPQGKAAPQSRHSGPSTDRVCVVLKGLESEEKARHSEYLGTLLRQPFVGEHSESCRPEHAAS